MTKHFGQYSIGTLRISNGQTIGKQIDYLRNNIPKLRDLLERTTLIYFF
jgi:hypothetical protein